MRKILDFLSEKENLKFNKSLLSKNGTTLRRALKMVRIMFVFLKNKARKFYTENKP